MKYLVHYSISGALTVYAENIEQAREMANDIPIEAIIQDATDNATQGYGIEIGTVEKNNEPDEKTLLRKLLEAGMQRDQIDNWRSDLYVLKNDISEKIIDEYKFNDNVKTFVCQTDGKLWYDIPFAFEEFRISQKDRRK